MNSIDNIVIDDSDTIDAYEVIDGNGSVKYIDEITFNDNIAKQKQELQDMIYDIKNNNPLNMYDNIESEEVATDEIKIVKSIPQVDKSFEKKKRHKMGYSLKRVACIFGLALGIVTAIKGSNKYRVKENNINIETQSNIDLSSKSVVMSEDNISNIKRNSEIRLTDTIELKNVNLNYTSQGEKPSVKEKKLNCDCYKINHIAILSEGEIVDVLKVDKKIRYKNIEQLKKNCSSIYGPNMKIQINVDGYINGKKVYKNIGWTSINNIKSEKKSYQKRKI